MNKTRMMGRARTSVVALALVTVAVGPLQAQARSDSASSKATQPALHGWREAGLTAAGASLLFSGALTNVRFRDVPAEGLNPLGLDFRFDRGSVGDLHPGASRMSDWTRNAAVAFPFALSLATSPGGTRTRGLARTAVVHAEAMLISQGLTLLGKKMLGRPRPYAYVPALDRPDGTSYDVTLDRTFVSMPSGHASSAWAGAALGLTEYMLSRPEAAWWERAGVGFVGGALAGATSALRVEAGQHFPSDVLAGAGIGIGVGVAVPLLHRGDRPIPGARSWLEMTGGVLVGTLLGTLAAERF